ELASIPDRLTERVCRAVGVASPRELVSAIYGPGWDRARIAALAPEVVGAGIGDRSVDDILVHAAHDLAEKVGAVIASLGWADDRNRDAAGPGPSTRPRLPLALAGGFLLGNETLRRAVPRILRESGYPCRATAVPEPVRGAVILARRALDE